MLSVWHSHTLWFPTATLSASGHVWVRHLKNSFDGISIKLCQSFLKFQGYILLHVMCFIWFAFEILHRDNMESLYWFVVDIENTQWVSMSCTLIIQYKNMIKFGGSYQSNYNIFFTVFLNGTTEFARQSDESHVEITACFLSDKRNRDVHHKQACSILL